MSPCFPLYRHPPRSLPAPSSYKTSSLDPQWLFLTKESHPILSIDKIWNSRVSRLCGMDHATDHLTLCAGSFAENCHTEEQSLPRAIADSEDEVDDVDRSRFCLPSVNCEGYRPQWIQKRVY